MRHLRKTLAALVFGVVLASLSQFPASAGEPPRPENAVARVNVGPTRVDWSPTVDYERIVLTVVGPEELVNRQELEAGQTPSLSLFKPNGERLPDGIYRYELQILQRGGGMKSTLQGGALLVQGGKFVSPNLAESPASPPAQSTSSKGRNITRKDSVVPDDLVVQGTACIGPSCANGDPDPNNLTLKGLNPRIFFHDLNADCVCYPARNWVLQANDPDLFLDDFILKDVLSGNIPFSVQGGAPSNTLVVTGGGFDHQESRVGIGTLVPLKNLHVLNADTPTIRLEQPVSPGPARSWDVGANNTQFFISDVTNSSSQPFRIRAGAPTSSIDVAASGNVGIGISSPLARLHVGTGEVRFPPGSGVTGWTVFNYSVDAKNYIRGTTIIADNGGNVGIGTASPVARLEVSGGEVRLPPGAGAAGFTHFNYSGDGKNYIRGTTIIADNASSVGIGTTAPSSKLHVNGGDIRVSGGSFIDDGVTLNAPDYVFEPSYTLMPLEKLREFVAQERHLPNVPNAREVKEQGLNLSQFQMRLLEKVEELTLYTLTQNEQLSAQQEQIARLAQQNIGLLERLAALEKTLPAPTSQEP